MIKTVNGTSGNDSLYDLENTQNYLFGLGGDDLLSAGDGNDHLYGGEGDDLLFSPGGGFRNVRTTLEGGAGNDTFVIPTSNSYSYNNSVVINDYHVGDNINIIKDASNNGESFDLSIFYYGSGNDLFSDIYNTETDDLIVTVHGTDHFLM